jgi:hypothetical protein
MGILARETSADGCHVNRFAELGFGDIGLLLEPFEHRFACGPGKRPAEEWFIHPWCLADEHNPAQDGATRDRRGMHFGAFSASAECVGVTLKRALTFPIGLIAVHKLRASRLKNYLRDLPPDA